ncbi:MAG: hypothetical protein QOF30_2788 [Acidimicrobiaceae bacterium]|jgi:hypothetical protein|nr:hypothetical protein [Acidimicrobiaceae bacterium]
MVPVNVILGAAGTAGFAFGLVRTRWTTNKRVGAPTGPGDADTMSREPDSDVVPTPTSSDTFEDL